MGMYQTIDEDDALEGEAPEGKVEARVPRRWLRWTALALLAAVAALAAVALLTSPTRAPALNPGAAAEARAAYLAALSETSPALRRARLEDFAQTYPGHERTDAVRAQLSVLGASEGSDWARVTDTLFDTRASKRDKLARLDAFEADWGADLLGGRADEIARLREELAQDPDPPPSRALEDTDSPIPDSIQSRTMAGGPVTMLPPAPPVLVEPPAPVRDTRREEPPVIRRAPQPRYPASAQRRGVGAVVTLEMDVDARGRVDAVRILSVDAERYGKDFARAAERAAKRTRFDPRTLDGVAVPASGVRKRYRFEP